MKHNHLFVLIFCFFCFVGCKDKANDNAEGTKDSQSTSKQFKVTLRVIAQKTDSFCLLYTEDGTINFGEQGIWKGIEGSENEQSVQFDFPEEIFPTSLRIDLGIEKEQSQVILKSVILEYNGKKREISGSELGLFFRGNENNCTFDVTTGIVKPVIKDGVRQNPCLYPSETALSAEIKKLAQ